jgi:hypothetical protein
VIKKCLENLGENLGKPKTPAAERIDPKDLKNFGSTPLGGPPEIPVNGLPKFGAAVSGEHEVEEVLGVNTS